MHALLHAEGLEGYYEVRALSRQTQSATAAEAEAEAGTFAYLDDPELQARIGAAKGQVRLQLTGLSCAACVWLIERLPQRLEGLDSARVNLGRGHVELRFDPAKRPLSEIAALLSRLGYRTYVQEAEAQRQRQRDHRSELVRLAVAGACAGNVMLLSFGLHAGRVQGMSAEFANLLEWAAMLIALPAVTYGAWPFFRGVGAALRNGRLHLDLPISLGIVASYGASLVSTLGRGAGPVASYYDSVTALIFLLLVGRWVQSASQRRALSRWNLLQRLLPQHARRRDPQGAFVPVPISRVQAGDLLEVRAGETLPADARVCSGQGELNAAAITGESRRQHVQLDDEVLAGCTLVAGTVQLEVLRVGEATRVGQLAESIATARADRAPLQRRVDRLSGVFTLTVVLAAAVSGLVWWTIDPSRVLDVVVAVLVVSCPCALGLATPMALWVARVRAAERGFSILGDSSLERLAGTRHVVFDKTGTLTEGRSTVHRADESTANYAREVAALEAEVGHPLARALRVWGHEAEATQPSARGREPACDVTTEPGNGVRGRVGAHQIRVGRPQWLSADPQHPALASVGRNVKLGLTPIALEVDGTLVGTWGVGDPLRPEAPEVVASLQAMGLQVSIASGDHRVLAEALGRSLGVTAVGDLSPIEKIQFVRERAPAAMIGDGVNDAAAMRSAHVGIAVHGAGEVAACVADVRQLRAQSLVGLVELFTGARATMRLIRRNLAISLAYNLGFGAAAVFGLIDPLVAAIGMPLSSLSVIALSSIGGGFRGERESAPAQNMRAQMSLFPADAAGASATNHYV